MIKLHNTQMSINSLRNSKLTNQRLEKNSSKMASGSRIVSASDDAAGLSIAAKLNSQNRSKDQANRNVNQAVSIVQIMDGVLGEMSSMVTRMRELAISAASDTYSNEERKMMAIEVNQLKNEIDRVSKSTTYQDHYVFKGDKKVLDIQVDANSGQSNRISIDLEEFAQNPTALGIGDISLDTKHQARLSLFKIDYAAKEISRSRAGVGAFMTRFNILNDKLATDSLNSKATLSKIKDVDYASETASNVKNKILQQSQTMLQAQINNSGKSALKLIG